MISRSLCFIDYLSRVKANQLALGCDNSFLFVYNKIIYDTSSEYQVKTG